MEDMEDALELSTCLKAVSFNALIDAITSLMEDWDGGAEGFWAQTELRPIFKQCTRGADRANHAQTKHFLAEGGRRFLNTPDWQILNEDMYTMLELDKQSSLEFHEAFSCFKTACLSLLRCLKEEGQDEKERQNDAISQIPFMSQEMKQYNIERELGSGGQAVALLATTFMNNKYCLKRYNKAALEGQVSTLLDEMRYLKLVARNPRITHCIEIFQDAHSYYMVSEFLPGGDLSEFRKRCEESGVGLTENLFKGIFTQCVEALEFIHRNAVLHCDVKERNLMTQNLDYSNAKVCLIDFGKARRFEMPDSSFLAGTPGYMPPEVWSDKKWFPRGDVFSMGVTFFQLLANKVPSVEDQIWGIFQGNTCFSADARKIVDEVEPPWDLVANQFPATVPWLSRMLDKKRVNRPKAPQLLKESWFQKAR